MTKTPATLDAITDVVLAYRPEGAGENAVAIARKMARKNIKSICPQCGAKRGFFCASNCPNAK
jgi:hypothetical protein